MKNRLIKPLILAALLIVTEAVAQSKTTNSFEDRITSKDLEAVKGEWTGSLTYIDYRSNQPYSMPADLTVEEGKNQFQFILNYRYPNEPQANSKAKFEISEDGMQINKNKVVSIERTEIDELIVKTEHSGKDNKKKATIRNIYIISDDKFVIGKEVKFEDSSEWLKRNEYSFNRKQ